ncbi:WD40 repeat-like protein [Coniophora puteana RWD-64-598 SS2]|uniref:WD40 repeat-like protein n=1 Tax=Coniophora puteana (strain RWD-64-598) TaxID=741705 RepID=A0A5M3MPY7_CONPW|nr:WD40 repeat-like protein [Coniophora puteana RWD-64-598 SS2]EIW80774.1 WD40 repeat-like protein [Coniophora puteana RWD-64-598 SS2]
MTSVSEEQQDGGSEVQSIDAQTTAKTDDQPFKPFTGHESGINTISYSPDGKSIATGSGDNTIRVWDANSGRQVGNTMRGHTNDVYNISYSPSGNSLVSCSHDGTVRFWDITGAGGAYAKTLGLKESLVRVAKYSLDGRYIATGGMDETLKIWDTREERLKAEYHGHTMWVFSAAWHPSGKRLATSSMDKKVRVFDLTKPNVVSLLIEGHRDNVNSLMYSPDGNFLASGANDCTVRLWDVPTGKAVKSPFRGHKRDVRSVAWSPDSTRIVSGAGDYTVRVWDASTGQTLFNGALYAHKIDIRSISYCSDGRFFASADGSGRVQVWDALTGKPSLPLLSDEELSSCKESARHNNGDDTRDSKPGEMRAGASISAIAWFSDGKRFATAGEEPVVRIWSANTGMQIGEITGHHETINALSISADGTKLATASDDHTVLLFDTRSMHLLVDPLTGHKGAVYVVKLTPDGTRVVSGGHDNTVRLWDARTGRALHVFETHTGAVRALSVTKDGSKLASGGDDNCVYVWDMRTFERLAGPFQHDGSVRSVSFAPDGSRLISGSDDFTARVWKIATGSLAFDPIRVHAGPIGVVDWSPDGTTLLTAGAHDWTIWTWDASTCERILGPLEPLHLGDVKIFTSLDGRANGIAAASFSPDGKRFVNGFMDHGIHMWDTATGKVILPKAEKDKNNESDSGKTEASKRDGVQRQPSLSDSIMNMPATVSRRNPASASRSFWDDTDIGAPSRRHGKSENGRKNTRNSDKLQNKGNILGRFWRQRADQPVSKIKGKNKEQITETNSPGYHAETRILGPPATEISAAHDKLRVVAAGYDPRERFRTCAEPEYDDERDSPTGSMSPVQPEDGSSSDDESEHGLVKTTLHVNN